MAARIGTFPGRRLATSNPLTRRPPTPDLFRLFRILEVENHHDVALIALDRRRNVRVPAVEIEAMHAAPFRDPVMDLFRLGWVTHIEDAEATFKFRRVLAVFGRGIDFVVDDHQPIADPRLVRMRARSHFKMGKKLRVVRILHVDDARARGRVNMADIGNAALDGDLPATRAIEETSPLYASC